MRKQSAEIIDQVRTRIKDRRRLPKKSFTLADLVLASTAAAGAAGAATGRPGDRGSEAAKFAGIGALGALGGTKSFVTHRVAPELLEWMRGEAEMVVMDDFGNFETRVDSKLLKKIKRSPKYLALKAGSKIGKYGAIAAPLAAVGYLGYRGWNNLTNRKRSFSMRKQSAEIIDSVVYNADPEELLYILRKTSDALEDALYPYASEEEVEEIRKLAEQEDGRKEPFLSFVTGPKAEAYSNRAALAGLLLGGAAGAAGVIGAANKWTKRKPSRKTHIGEGLVGGLIGAGLGAGLGSIAGNAYGLSQDKKEGTAIQNEVHLSRYSRPY